MPSGGSQFSSKKVPPYLYTMRDMAADGFCPLFLIPPPTARSGVECELEALPYAVARWVDGGWDLLEKAGTLYNTLVLRDPWGRPVLLFRNAWNEGQLVAECPKLAGKLMPTALPPTS